MNVGSAAGVAAKQLVDGIAPTVQDVNVAIVQKILNETFRQRIHGPPGLCLSVCLSVCLSSFWCACSCVSVPMTKLRAAST